MRVRGTVRYFPTQGWIAPRDLYPCECNGEDDDCEICHGLGMFDANWFPCAPQPAPEDVTD